MLEAHQEVMLSWMYVLDSAFKELRAFLQKEDVWKSN